MHAFDNLKQQIEIFVLFMKENTPRFVAMITSIALYFVLTLSFPWIYARVHQSPWWLLTHFPFGYASALMLFAIGGPCKWGGGEEEREKFQWMMMLGIFSIPFVFAVAAVFAWKYFCGQRRIWREERHRELLRAQQEAMESLPSPDQHLI